MKSESVAFESERVGEKARGHNGSVPRAALVALTVTLTLQVARVFLPMVFDLGERSGMASGAIKAGALAIMVFLAPLIAPVLPRSLGGKTALVTTLSTLAGLRVVIQLVHPIPLWLSTVAMVIALLNLTLLLVTMKSSEGIARGHEFALGTRRGTGHRHGAPECVLVVGLRLAVGRGPDPVGCRPRCARASRMRRAGQRSVGTRRGRAWEEQGRSAGGSIPLPARAVPPERRVHQLLWSRFASRPQPWFWWETPSA